jgi:hypothetical protein
MKMTKLHAAIAATLFTGAAGFAFAAEGMPKSEYKAQKDQIEATGKAALDACKPMSGNAKDICKEQAKADESIAKADLEAKNKGTREAAYDARVAHAKGNYNVAKEKCDDFKGNQKDVCVKEAKAVETRALADAKADKKVVQARVDARDDKMDAEYKVAKEKCDAFAGDAKDRCVLDAKQHYGKS